MIIHMIIPTSQNAAVLFLDLQDDIVANSRTVSIDRLKRTTGALAKLAGLHRLPTCETWCGRWESNPHDVAIEGF